MKECNVSNLTKALAVVSLLVPATGYPLSIGDIELHSTLNQNLNAEIRLHLDEGENPADVTVRMAPPEKFDQAGIPWSYFLSRIKFELVTRQHGTVVIKVSSKETLTEPFLDFLLEVNWASGSQFREFTVLLDPPAEYERPVNPVTGAIGSYRVEEIDPSAESYRKPRNVVRRSTASRASMMPAKDVAQRPATSGEYGPTQADDTLWSIATELANERGVSPKQMMQALYQANPEAFTKNDMDMLKAGVTLKIPALEGAQKPAANAHTETKPSRKPAVAAGKGLELIAPVESQIAENAQINEKAQPAPGKSKGAGSDSGKDAELQSRIEKLEQQLGMMQQLLALKDQQLANIQQNTAKPAATQPVPPVEQPVTAKPNPQPIPVPAPKTEVPEVKAPAEAQPIPAPVTPTVVAQVPPPAAKPPQPAPVAQEENFFASDTYYLAIGGLGLGILSALGWLLWRKRKIDEQTSSESMFSSASQITMPDPESSLSVPVLDLDNTTAYDVGTVGESSFINDFTPSDFDAFDTDQNEVDPLSEADVYLAYGRYQQAEELMRNALAQEPEKDSFKQKLLEIFYAAENKKAFADYAMELAANGKQSDIGFWSKVSEMAKEIVPDLPLFGGGAGSASPELELVNQERGISTQPASAVELAESEFGVDDYDLDDLSMLLPVEMAVEDEKFGLKSAEAKLDNGAETFTNEHSLDFDTSSPVESDELDFDTKSLKVDKNTQEQTTDTPDIETIDFDLSDFSFKNANEKAELDQANAPIEAFDFNFDVDDLAPAAKDVASNSDPEVGKSIASNTNAASSYTNPQLELDSALDIDVADNSLDFAFDESTNLENEFFSSFPKTEPELSKNRPISAPSEPIGEFDFNFDFDVPVAGKSDSEDFDLSVSDLTDMDEFETKIDLAKAYVDMGDTDAAKLIAEEVLAKGTKNQKAIAQALLDELK